MTTMTQACAAIRAVMEDNVPANPKSRGPAITYRWRGEPAPPLPDTPDAPVIFTLFAADRSKMIENGGGRGANRHRNPGEAEILIFIPKDWGEQYGTDIAEHFAALFRAFNSNGVTVESATVYPEDDGSGLSVPGVKDNELANYICCACGIDFYFDLIG